MTEQCKTLHTNLVGRRASYDPPISRMWERDEAPFECEVVGVYWETGTPCNAETGWAALVRNLGTGEIQDVWLRHLKVTD